MNLQQYVECQKAIVIVLKKKYTNLSAVEAIDMASEIINVITPIVEKNDQPG